MLVRSHWHVGEAFKGWGSVPRAKCTKYTQNLNWTQVEVNKFPSEEFGVTFPFCLQANTVITCVSK